MPAPDQLEAVDVDERLRSVASGLAYPLAERLIELLDASAAIHELLDLRHRVRRAEDLVAELRRHLAIRERQLRDAQEAIGR